MVLNDENIVKSAFSKMENFNVGNIGAQQVVQLLLVNLIKWIIMVWDLGKIKKHLGVVKSPLLYTQYFI